MSYSNQTFSVGSTLTSSKVNLLDESIDAVRASEIGSSEPANSVAGQFWVDNSSATRDLNINDGSDNITILKLNPSTNSAELPSSFAGGDSYGSGVVSSTKIQSLQIGKDHINAGSVSEFAERSIGTSNIVDGSITLSGGKATSTVGSYNVSGPLATKNNIAFNTGEVTGSSNQVVSLSLSTYMLMPDIAHLSGGDPFLVRMAYASAYFQLQKIPYGGTANTYFIQYYRLAP